MKCGTIVVNLFNPIDHDGMITQNRSFRPVLALFIVANVDSVIKLSELLIVSSLPVSRNLDKSSQSVNMDR